MHAKKIKKEHLKLRKKTFHTKSKQKQVAYFT